MGATSPPQSTLFTFRLISVSPYRRVVTSKSEVERGPHNTNRIIVVDALRGGLLQKHCRCHFLEGT